MKVILKLDIHSIKDGKKVSNTKHVQLGDTLEFDKDEEIQSISLLDVTTVIGREDCK
jgi:hypothetical protein